MGRRLTNAKMWTAQHKPEILGVTGTVLGVAAFGTAIYCTHKWGSDDYKQMKSKHASLISQRNSGKISKEEFRKSSNKNIANGAGKLAKHYALPVALEVGSIVCTGLAGNAYRGQIKSLAMTTASLGATIAMMQDNIKTNYGKDAVKKIMTIPATKKIEVSDEKGKKKKVEVEVADPKLMCVDSVAYEDSIKYGMPYSPTRIKIDERFSLYNTCNGEISQMLYPLHCAKQTCDYQLHDDGVITVWDIVKQIGLESNATKTINKSMAKVYGIIDQPKATNRYTGQVVDVPGFKKEGKYLCNEHKNITFGDAVDAMLEDYDDYDIHGYRNDNPEVEMYAYDESKNREYLYIDIGTDGDISMFRLEEQPKERKISAWHQDPKSQQ